MDSVPSYKGMTPGPVRLAAADETPDGAPRWLVSRYDDVVEALNHPHLRMQGFQPSDSAECSFSRLVDRESGDVPAELTATEIIRREVFFVFDPPVHERVRKQVVRYFSAKRLEAMRPRVQQIADELLDAIAGREQVDLVDVFAFPLPVRVLCEVLNIPEPIRSRLLTRKEGSKPVIPLEVAQPAAAELVETRRREPIDDDMISTLVAAHEEGRVTEKELHALPIILLIAGYLTTVHMIGSSVLTLLQNPERFDELRRDPSLVAPAVEELLRYQGSVSSVSRFAREDIVIGGTTIPKGSHVRVMMGSANRDPGAYIDPDALDFGRGGHGLAFGHGINYCLGSYLAKVELEVAIGTVIRRFPDLALVEPVRIGEIEDGVLGVERLPVRLTAPTGAV